MVWMQSALASVQCSLASNWPATIFKNSDMTSHHDLSYRWLLGLGLLYSSMQLLLPSIVAPYGCIEDGA